MIRWVRESFATHRTARQVVMQRAEHTEFNQSRATTAKAVCNVFELWTEARRVRECSTGEGLGVRQARLGQDSVNKEREPNRAAGCCCSSQGFVCSPLRVHRERGRCLVEVFVGGRDGEVWVAIARGESVQLGGASLGSWDATRFVAALWANARGEESSQGY